MPLRLFNTMTKKKELFKTLKDKQVKLFVCGVTVYNYSHLGHARTYAFYDTLVRFLRYLGYKVNYLQNVTDVGHLFDTGEDKILKKAKEEKKDPMEIAQYYLDDWLEMMEKLRIKRPDLMPRATHHIKEIVEQVGAIIKNGYAYVTPTGVYFNISKFQDYGKLSHQKPKELEKHRIEPDITKKNIQDFSLWQYKREDQLTWDLEIELEVTEEKLKEILRSGTSGFVEVIKK